MSLTRSSYLLTVYLIIWIRLALNLKGIPYKTHFIEIVDIEAICIPLSMPPSGTKPTGAPHYTLPAILDDSAPGNVIKMSDSRPIIEYLDHTYPSKDGTRLFPADTETFQDEVQDIVNTRILAQAPFLWLLDLYRVKTPKDQDNIKTRMEGRFGKSMNEIIAKGEDWDRRWAEVQQAFSDIDRLAQIHRASNGPFLLGQHVSYADVVLCALLLCLKICITAKEWQQIASWNQGRWSGLLDGFQPWIHAEGYQPWRD
jgi:glutathione S-transferase